jgi:hypothetical protein
VGLLLLAVGGLLTLLFIIDVLVRTIRRSERLGVWEVRLAFFVALIPLSALIVNQWNGAADDRVETDTRWLALILIGFSLVILIAEIFRPQRLRQSRGIFGVGIGILLLIASVTVPFIAIYTSLSVSNAVVLPTPINNTPQTAQPNEDPVAQTLDVVIGLIGDHTGLDKATITARVEAGATVAQLVEASHGDLNTLIDQISKAVSDQIPAWVADCHISRTQGALLLLGMKPLITWAVNNDLNALADRLRETTQATREPGDTNCPSTLPPNADTPTLTAPAHTPTATATSTPSHTPRPTPSPTATRQPYVSRTPTFTPTLPNPCLAVMNYNVNLRAAPDPKAQVITTIPYQTAVTVWGRNAESTWWFALYNDQAGWINAQFITLSASCASLPVRK